jgi:hypothetical protein
MAAEVNNDPIAERLACNASTGASWNQGDLLGDRITDQRLDVPFMARGHDTQRLDLEDTGVSAVKSAGQFIEKQLPRQDAAQVVANALTLRFIHVR